MDYSGDYNRLTEHLSDLIMWQDISPEIHLDGPEPCCKKGERVRDYTYSMDGTKMDKSVLGAMRVGLPMLMLGFCGGQTQAQTPIALQPLQPVATTQQGGMMPLPPLAIAPKGPITLEKIPTAVPAIPVSVRAKVNVLPLKREGSATASNGQPRTGKLKVDDMVRKPVDVSTIFSKVKIEQSTLPVEMAGLVRTQRMQGMGDFEWTPSGYCWQSPAFCHSPLYFEQPNLERYGNTTYPALAPAVSATYFFGQVTLLPFKTLYQTPWSKSCTLGHHRPGDCAPFQRRKPNHVQLGPVSSQTVPSQGEVIWSETAVGDSEPVNQVIMQTQVENARAVSAIPPSKNPIQVKMSD